MKSKQVANSQKQIRQQSFLIVKMFDQLQDYQLAKKHITMNRKVSYNEDQDDEVNLELEGYNQQYSLILQLAKEFIQEAKQAISKYLEKTKFPYFLNKGIASKWIINVEQTLNDPKKFNTQKEKQFSQILMQLKRNICDMITFEKTFKKQFQQSMKRTPHHKVDKNLKSTDTTQCTKFQKRNSILLQNTLSEASNNTQQQSVISSTSKNKNEVRDDERLRKQLRRIVLPKVIKIDQQQITEIQQINTQTIMHRIQFKINKMRAAMNRQIQRESNIIQIFEKRKIVVPDINTEHPGITQLLKQIEQLKQRIVEKDNAIKFLESKVQTMYSDSIVVQRYTIPKSQKLLNKIQDGVPINLNINYGDINSPRQGQLSERSFKKKASPNRFN